MDVELQSHYQHNNNNKDSINHPTPPPTQPPSSLSKTLNTSLLLLLLNVLLMAVGNTAGPLLLRLYFSSGGSRVWLSSCLQTLTSPLLIPLLPYLRPRQSQSQSQRLFSLTPKLLLSSSLLGLLLGLDNFLYTYGLSFLPVSTSSLLVSTQLVFTALFAFLVVKQKFTPYSLNSVALLSVGAVLLGLHASSDRPAGVSAREYYMGFALTVGAAALYGLVLPLIELMYRKAGQAVTYGLVIELQIVMGISATVFCLVGMIINKDFQGMARESKTSDLGEVGYYNLIVWSAIAWQCFFLGTVGVIFCANTLLAGVLIAVFIPVTEILAVIFLHENFSSEKAVALVLALWGLASYSYGEYRLQIKSKKKQLVQP